MRVALLTGTLHAGGLERFVTRIAIGAAQEKVFQPVVICLNTRAGIFLAELEQAGVEVIQAPRRWYRSPVQWLRLVNLLRKLKPEIIHSQVNFSMAQQFLAAAAAGARFTVTERNCYKREGFALFRRRVQYGLMKKFGVRYSANSGMVAQHLGKMLRERIEAFPVLPNGIEVAQDPAFTTNDGTPAAPVSIVYVARMASHKGHLFFLDVLDDLLNRRGLSCHATLIGDGPQRSLIEQTIEQKGLSNHVRLTGVVSNVHEYIRDADILALLSEFEGMPNVIIEAMAEGTPVIATDIGNAKELLGSGAGVTLERRDLSEAVVAFESVIREPALRRKMGEAGRQRIGEAFSLSLALDKLVSYYRKLLEP